MNPPLHLFILCLLIFFLLILSFCSFIYLFIWLFIYLFISLFILFIFFSSSKKDYLLLFFPLLSSVRSHGVGAASEILVLVTPVRIWVWPLFWSFKSLLVFAIRYNKRQLRGLNPWPSLYERDATTTVLNRLYY